MQREMVIARLEYLAKTTKNITDKLAFESAVEIIKSTRPKGKCYLSGLCFRNREDCPKCPNYKNDGRRGRMTNKEAIKLIQEIEEDGRNVTKEHIEALGLAIKVLNRYKPLCPIDFPTEDDPYPVCIYERPTGKWIKDEQGVDRCSKCFHRCMEFVMGKPKDNFCIECGADMRGGEE